MSEGKPGEEPGNAGEPKKENRLKPQIHVRMPSLGDYFDRYRLFITVVVAYAVAFVIVLYVIPRIAYMWWGSSGNTAIGYYLNFAVPLILLAPLLLITFGLIWHVHNELTDPIMNAIRQRATQKLIEDKKYSEKIDKMAENYLTKHLEKYGIVKVVKPGVKDRVVMLIKRSKHQETVVM